MLNSTVKKHLAMWFERKGAVRSAHRLDRTRTSQGTSPVARLSGDRCAERPPSSFPTHCADTATMAEVPADDGYLNVAGEGPNQTAIGMRCVVAKGAGTVRFVGNVGDRGTFIGIELDAADGLNNGSAKGVRYFHCAPNFGVFVHPDGVKFANPKTTSLTTTPNAARPEPPNQRSADATRRTPKSPERALSVEDEHADFGFGFHI